MIQKIFWNNLIVRSFCKLLYKINRLPFFENSSIRKKLLIGFLFASMVPILCSTFIQHSYLSSNYNSQFIETTKNNLTQANLLLDTELDTISKNVSILLLDNSFIDELYVPEELTVDELVAKILTIDNILDNYSNSFNVVHKFPIQIVLYVDWNTVPIYNEYFNTIHVNTYEQFEKIYNKKITASEKWLGVHKLHNVYSSKYLSYITPVYDSQNSILGYLEIAIDATKIYKHLESALSNYENSEFFIIDSRKQLVGTKSEDNDIYEYLESILYSSDIDLIPDRITILEDSAYKNILYYNKRGYLLLFKVPTDVIISYASSSSLLALISSLGGILLSVMLSFTISHSLYVPIRNLTYKMQNKYNRYGSRKQTQEKNELKALYGAFNEMNKDIQNLIATVNSAELELKKAEFALLQENINPHFLYNTLDTIHWIAISNKQTEISKIVRALSTILRNSLNQGRQLIPISSEIDLIQQYMYIQTLRNDKICINYDIDDELLTHNIPKLLIQPLVENAIKHSFRVNIPALKILIRVYTENAFLCIEVCNNGQIENIDLLNQITKQEIHHDGYGISNIVNRIKLYYGEQSGLTYYSNHSYEIIAKISLLESEFNKALITSEI